MADGSTGPDFGAMLALKNFSSQTSSGGRPVIIAALLPGGGSDVNVGQGLSLQGKGLNADATFKITAQPRPGMLANLIKSMGADRQSIMEGLKKVGDAGAVRQASQTELFGQGGPAGGSTFSDVAAPRSSGGIDI